MTRLGRIVFNISALLMLAGLAVAQDVRLDRGRPGGASLPPPEATALDCPSEAPPPVSTEVLGPGDFVELERTSCFGSCPVYTVRIQADGSVNWKGTSWVAEQRPIVANIDPAVARALIESLNRRFWSLCGRYTYLGTDSSTTITTLHIGNREKRVSNYANQGPPQLQQFELEVDSAADTHRWIHGDPRKELIDKARTDGRTLKTGLSALMRAANVSDVAEIKRLLEAHPDLNAQDSSGWTALVYAAQGIRVGRVDETTNSSGIEAVRMLLAAGADPNIRSFMDQTPLMAAVTVLYSPVERARLLIAAGAEVNVQDQTGRTALMQIISGALLRNGRDAYAKQVELCSMLVAAGARTDLKNSDGLTVFDILERDLSRVLSTPSLASEAQSFRAQHDALLRSLRDK